MTEPIDDTPQKLIYFYSVTRSSRGQHTNIGYCSSLSAYLSDVETNEKAQVINFIELDKSDFDTLMKTDAFHDAVYSTDNMKICCDEPHVKRDVWFTIAVILFIVFAFIFSRGII